MRADASELRQPVLFFIFNRESRLTQLYRARSSSPYHTGVAVREVNVLRLPE